MREARLSYDDLMQMILEKVCAAAASMTIIYRKEGAFGPGCWILALWARDVEDDGDTIFVVIPLDTLMRISSITGDKTVRF